MSQTYHLLDDDGFMYAVQYIFTKLASSPLSVNTTYSVSLDTTNEWIVLTGSDGNSTHVSYSDFGEDNIINTVKVNGTALTPDANKAVNIPAATDSVTGAMTSTDHTKLTGIAAGAQVNVLEGVQLNGSDLTITNKKVNIPAAGSTTKGVISNADVNALIQAAISGITGISFLKVGSYAALPAVYSNAQTYALNDFCIHDGGVYKCTTAISVAEEWNATHWTYISNVYGTFFLVPNSGTAPNIYDEYIYTITDSTSTPVTYGYEKIGTTAIDLSGYVQYTDITLLTNTEIADIVDDAYDDVFNPTP